MIDIKFYMGCHDFKQRVMAGELRGADVTPATLEAFRRDKPVLYNIETTNACNMRCRMCPRTTLMTRSVTTLDMGTFERIVEQLEPWSASEWAAWQDFVERRYGVDRNDMAENHFFLHIIPRVIVLHGYGDPLLDRFMPKRVRLMTERGLPSYFSCNPANIRPQRMIEMFEAGLDYVKYSIESVDDIQHKQIRGQASDFTTSYEHICWLLEQKQAHGYGTTIVITMLDLGREHQAEDYERLYEAFAGKDVYIYLKSQDQQWYVDEQHGTSSIHWTEFCQFPWSSMTIKSDGMAAMCVEDYDNEIILGDARTQSLMDIWNGEPYRRFREQHFEVTPGIKCTERCDMKLIGELI